MTGVWALLAAVALLWPDHVISPFDGAPLDRPFEAILIGVVFPILWWYAPRFLATRIAQACIVLLLASRLATTVFTTRQGWCVRFEPARPYVGDQSGAPHAWDVRADWRSRDPACSAIMTRDYAAFEEFPVWFFNLPPADDGWPTEQDRPPGATTHMAVRGFLNARQPGTLRFDMEPAGAFRWGVDGGSATTEAKLEPGSHLITIDATLTGDRWRLVPSWDNAQFPWDRTSVKRQADGERLLVPWVRWVPSACGLLLAVAWVLYAAKRTVDPVLLGWSAVASIIVGELVMTHRDSFARMAVGALILATALPLRARSRNIRGAFVAIGIPWVAFVVACAAPAIGRFVLYEVGHDYWMYQRFAYRIVMQGHWLEGGAPTFWFQPFYRWIVGALHLVFGDSSVGEWFWDGACLLAMALFTFEVTRRARGFRWGLAAGVLPLAIFVIGTPQYLIGRGLGEITSAGLLSAAALVAMRSRHGKPSVAIAAGVLATLAFFTRLNNLPMALGTAIFAYRRNSWRPALVVLATIGTGVALLACRTWYFTGSVNPFIGTQRNLLAIWQPGMPVRTGVARTIDSVLMVLTVNDPPRFDPFAIPVLLGASVAVAALISREVRRVAPVAASLFFMSGIAGAFVARGSAYPGRFSLHVLGVTCALSMCAISAAAARIMIRRQSS